MKTTAIRIEGGILTPDILEEIHSKSGQQSVDFGLKASESVKDEIARTFTNALAYWDIFQIKLESLKMDNPATSVTRNQLIVPLLGLLGYDKLEYQKRGLQRNGKSYTISHLAVDHANMPVHIVGYQYEYGLDTKPKTTTGRRMSAHAMVQEYINMGEELYAIVTDGHRLRLMRNTSRLVKFSYLEIDLERIFTENLFSDFAIFYRLLHATRLPSTLEEAPECWFEQYHQDSLESGARIRDKLSVAVQTAIDNFGNGLLNHPDNHELRKKVDDGLSMGVISTSCYCG